MTLYLWHLTAMVVVVAGSVAAGGFGLGSTPNTTAWWLTRPVWFAVLAAVTVSLALVFARFERPGPDSRPEPRSWRSLMAVALTCFGLAMLAHGGIADPDGINGLVLAAPVVGVLLGGVGGARLGSRPSDAQAN